MNSHNFYKLLEEPSRTNGSSSSAMEHPNQKLDGLDDRVIFIASPKALRYRTEFFQEITVNNSNNLDPSIHIYEIYEIYS